MSSGRTCCGGRLDRARDEQRETCGGALIRARKGFSRRRRRGALSNVYGIDMPTRDELIASGRTEAQVAREIGCDELIYQDLEALVEDVHSVNPRVESFESSCFSGVYITGDVTQAYLDGVEAERRDGAKRAEEAAISTQLTWARKVDEHGRQATAGNTACAPALSAASGDTPRRCKSLRVLFQSARRAARFANQDPGKLFRSPIQVAGFEERLAELEARRRVATAAAWRRSCSASWVC